MPKRAARSALPGAAIAYAYSDKYRKKTLRLGDLLHLDEERTQNRLHMILDAKNMELAG